MMTIAALTVPALATTGRRVIAATSAGLYVSDDAGATWRRATPTPAGVQTLAFLDSTLLLTGGASGVTRSDDSGATWTTTLVGSPIASLAAGRDRSGKPIVLAGTDTDGVFRSEDGGIHWDSANPGLLDLETLVLAMSPAFTADNTGFVGTATGLYRTRNGGKPGNHWNYRRRSQRCSVLRLRRTSARPAS